MEKSRKRYFRWLLIYVIVGVLYASFLGANTRNAILGLQNKQSEFNVVEISSAYLSDNYYQVCLLGQLDDEIGLQLRQFNVDFNSLSRIIESNGFGLPQRARLRVKISEMERNCLSGKTNEVIEPLLVMMDQVTAGPNTIVRHISDLHDRQTSGSMQLFIVDLKLMESKLLVIRHKSESDELGYIFIDFEGEPLEPEFKDYTDVAQNYLIDILTYPYQVLMWFEYMDSH